MDKLINIIFNKEQQKKYECINNYCIRRELVVPKDNVFKKLDYIKRLDNKYSLMNIETKIVREKVEGYISEYKIEKNGIVLDLGCGDGRITSIFLEQGFKNIVDVDVEEGSIKELVYNLNTHRNNILPIVDDVNNVEFKKEIFDVIIAWGTLSSVQGEYTHLVQKISKFLKKDGIFIIAEPTLESHLIYSLVRRDIDEFSRILNSKTRSISWEKREERYRLFYHKEIRDFIQNVKELYLIKEDGIDLFPSLIFGGLLYDVDKNYEDTQKKLLDDLREIYKTNDILYRQIIYILKK